jgi:quinol-cytochrome oxidoreductase complex cytochrome b subunit
VLFVLPWLDRSPVRSAKFRPMYQFFFWIFLLDCLLLGKVGAEPPEGPWPMIGLLATIYYFAFFLIIMPLLSIMERPRPLPASIAEAVLKGGGGGYPAGARAKSMEKA